MYEILIQNGFKPVVAHAVANFFNLLLQMSEDEISTVMLVAEEKTSLLTDLLKKPEVRGYLVPRLKEAGVRCLYFE